MNSEWPVLSEEVAKQLADEMLQQYGERKPLLRHSFDEIEGMPTQLTLPFGDVYAPKSKQEQQDAMTKIADEAERQAREVSPDVTLLVNGNKIAAKITASNAYRKFAIQVAPPLFSACSEGQIADEAGLIGVEVRAYYDTILAIRDATHLTDAEAYQLHTILCKLATPFYHNICAFDLAKALYLTLQQERQ